METSGVSGSCARFWGVEPPAGATIAVADEVRAEAERLAADPSFPGAYLARVRPAGGHAGRPRRRPQRRPAPRAAGGHRGRRPRCRPGPAPAAGEADGAQAHRLVRPVPGPPGRRAGPGLGPVRPDRGRAARPDGSGTAGRAGGHGRRDRPAPGPGRRARSPPLTAVHQFLPVFAAGDAIGNHVLRIRDPPRGAGYESEIFPDDTHPPVRKHARHFLDFRPPTDGRGVHALYHLSTGSRMAAWLAEQPVTLAVDYHNITPAEYFDRWQPQAAEVARAARSEERRVGNECRSRWAL